MAATAEPPALTSTPRRRINLPRWLADVTPSPADLQAFAEELQHKCHLLHASNDQLREALREEDDPVLSEALYENMDVLARFFARLRKISAIIKILNTWPLGDLQLVRCEEDLDDEVLEEEEEEEGAATGADASSESGAGGASSRGAPVDTSSTSTASGASQVAPAAAADATPATEEGGSMYI